MPKLATGLTDTRIKALKPKDARYTLADGDGLVIEIMTSGSKVWRYRYTLNGERRPLVTIGDYPAITLQGARDRARRYNELVQNGVSPAEVAKKDRGAAKVENTIRSVFEAWIGDQLAGRSTLKYQTEVRRSFEKDILTQLGKRAPSDVTVADVRKITDSIKARGSVQAALQTRNRLKRFFNYAIAAGYAETNPAQAAEVHFIAPQSSRTRVLTPNEIGEVMRAVHKANMRRAMKLAVHLLMITLVRKTELTEARWTEFDLDAAIWRIPADRMKKDKEHWVYLSDQAVEMFRELQEMTAGDFVFPTTRYCLTQPIDPSTLNDAVKALQMDMPRFVLHDFRRTASTHLHDMGHSSDAIEKCLAHSIKGMRGVYNRAEYAEDRRKILQIWADFVDKQIANKGYVAGDKKARPARPLAPTELSSASKLKANAI